MHAVWHVCEKWWEVPLPGVGRGGLLRGRHLVALCVVHGVKVRELEEVR